MSYIRKTLSDEFVNNLRQLQGEFRPVESSVRQNQLFGVLLLVASSAGLLGIIRRHPQVSLEFRLVTSVVFGVFVLVIVARIWRKVGAWDCRQNDEHRYRWQCLLYSALGAFQASGDHLSLDGGRAESDGTAACAAVGASRFGGGGRVRGRCAGRTRLALRILRGGESGEFRELLEVPGGRRVDWEVTG